jgi:hypothetical protein
MVRKDKLKVWIPIEAAPTPMYVEGLHDDYNGLQILLKGESATSGVLQIIFEDKVSYRNTNENYLLNIWDATERDILGKIFYNVENSSYIEYLNVMSKNIYADWQLKHFAIYTVSDCIDIICATFPTVKWLD